MSTKVVVIGAGVTGLSAALRLKQENPGFQVTVVARDFPAPAETFFFDQRASINYTSPWGGAHNRWVLWNLADDGSPAADAAARDHAFALATYRHMQATRARWPEAGITFLPGIEYLEAPGPEYTQLADAAAQQKLGLLDEDLALGFRVLEADKDGLPDGVTWGCAYRTWCVNPMVYCQFLMRRFVAAGGRVAKRELRSPAELFFGSETDDVPDVVVNCSGSGFGDDPHMFVTRGQTCLVRNACDATVTRQNADGSWSFSVPRFFDGGTVVGGTKEVDNWDAAPSAATRERLLANFAKTYPKILEGSSSKPGEFDVLADIVGRRPTRRGGMRLEAEAVDVASDGDSQKKGTIVHAYGVGGRGYEVSWGVAGAVAELVKKSL